MTKKAGLKNSKFLVWQRLQSDETLKQHQPYTELYTADRVESFLSRFKSVFVKPDNSYGGNDVIKLSKGKQGYYSLHNGNKRRFDTVSALTQWLDRIVLQRKFVMQQGIDLAKLNGSAVDLRTILIEKNGVWETTGMFAKVAKKGLAVTNVKAGGSILPVEAYLKGMGMDEEQQQRVIQEMKTLSERIADTFTARYRNRVLGLDVALDRHGKLWLIEVNTLPSLKILRRIDKRMYERTMLLLGTPWKF